MTLPLPLDAQALRSLSPNDQRARDIFEQLININTTGSSGSTTVASNAMAKRLLDAGLPPGDVQVIGPDDSKNHNLVARFRGTGTQKPILLLAHIDVVEARREDWSVDPFTLLERDGFFYGRGTLDVKDGAAILVATLARLKQEGYRPNRDLILALTTGEEGGSDYNGVAWLLANHRDLIDAAFVINMDAGDPVVLNGKRLMRTVQASEKVYVTFKLEVHNAGGHSSLPTKDNAIYRLLHASALEEVKRTLNRGVDDTAVVGSVVTAAPPSPPSPLKPEIMDPVERVTKRLWNIPVVPVMETGATDGLYLRNAGIPVYGVSGVFVDINDIRAHGRDERIGVQDYYDGAEYIYQLVKAVSSTQR